MKQLNIMETKLTRICEISKTKPKEIFTSIYHFLNKDLLIMCHNELNGKKATGLDGITKEEYEKDLENNITQLVEELQNMRYKPSPAKRVYIPKANGKLRGLAIAQYEDKIVQLAVKKIVEAIYEPKLLDCMYGFRPNRSCHKALKALNKNIEQGRVNYVVEADIKGFFDNIDHKWLIKCIEQHIKDTRMIRLIKRFLIAGIMEDGKYIKTEQGTPQGSILSPVLANIYMHYVLALWFEKKVKPNFKGESYITIYADDYVCCFQYKQEAELFYKTLLPNRLDKFNLELAKDKTRMLLFGTFAEQNTKGRKPETFDFLGFTHYCSKSKKGRFRVKRKTSRKKKKMQIKEYKNWIKRNRNLPLKDIINKTNEKLRGYYQYFGITDNYRMISEYYWCVRTLIYKWLNRRSQRKSYTFEQFGKMLETYPLLRPKIYVNIYDI